MMRISSKSGRFLAGLMAVVFLMTSLLTFSVSADLSIAETSTTTVAPGETATITVNGASGTEQTTVLVYLGTPDDENIIFIDQKAAEDGTATFTFKVPTTAAAGEYTVLAGSESATVAGSGSVEVTAGDDSEPEANDNVRNGKYGLAVTVDTAYNFRGNYSVNVEPNTEYILAAWSKGSGSVLIRPRQNDGWSDSDNLGDLDLAGGSSWNQSAKIITTTESATRVVLSLVTNKWGGAGTRYIDDIYLAKVSDPTVNLIGNPGFEAEGGWGYDTDAVRIESGVEMANNPAFIAVSNAKTAYYVNDEFEAPTVSAINMDGTTATVEGATFEGYDISTEGTQRVTVKTENAVTFYNITVEKAPIDPDATLESIAVSDAKTEYTVGDEFVAPKVIAAYDDGSTEEVEATFEGFDSETAGEKTITVKYEDKTTSYTVTVSEVVNWAVVATRDGDDTVGFASNAFDSRWTGQTSADKVSITGANGQGLDGTNALGFDYARSGQWGGTQTATLPASVDLAKTKYVSFYARIIPTSGTTSNNFTINLSGGQCRFDATTGWQFFTFDFSEADLTATTQLQVTQNNSGAGKLVIDNLAFSNYQIEAISPLLQGIAVSDQKTEYTTGDDFVAPTVTATYNDETTAAITDATIDGYDMETAGKQTVTVSYKGFTATYDIMVAAPVKVVKSIAVADDVKTEYTVGDSFVAPAVTATYEDDSSEVVTGAAFTGYDMTTAGTQTVTVSYGGQTITYDITVAEGDLEPWAVVATRDGDDTVGFASNAFDGRWQGETSSDKISNANGSGLGLDGTNSTAFTYSRAGGWSGVQTATLPATVDLAKTTNFSFYARIIPTTEGVTSSSFNVNFAGDAKCSFEATTGWKFFTFDLSAYDLTSTTQLQFLVNSKTAGSLILDNLTFSNYGVSPISPLLQSIAVSNATTEFELGGEFVAPTVTATYSDGTTVEVEATYDGYNMASNGVQTVTATYQGFTATYDITVGDAEGPVANENVRNGKTSAKVTVATSSYDFHLKYGVALEPNTDYILSAWSKGGGSVILVGRLNGSWGGSEARNLSLNGGDEWQHNVMTFNSGAVANEGKVIDSVTLCFVTNGFGSHGTMYVDDVFLAKASDPTVNLIPDPGFELGEWGTDNAVAMEVSELDVSSERITLAAINEKTEYLVGDEFVAPTKVVIVKNDGTTQEVTGATIEGYDMDTEGTQTVTVKYDNLSTKYPITVAKEAGDEPTLETIAVADDAKVEYTVGDEFVAPVVTATYSDGSSEEVEAEFTGYDMTTAGAQTVTVSYEGKTATYEITVKDKEPVVPDVEIVKSYLDLDFSDAAYAQKDDGTGTMVDDYWNMTTTNKATGNKVTVAFAGSNQDNRYQVQDVDGNKFIATKGRKTNITYDIRPEESVSDTENLVYVEARVKRISPTNDDPVSIVFTDDNANPIFRLNYKENVTPVLVADATYETVTYPNDGEWTYIRAIIDFSKSTFELYQGTSLDNMVGMVDGTTTFGFASSAANITRITNMGIGDTKGSLGFDDIKIYTVAKEAGDEPTLETIAVADDAKVEYTVGDEFVAPVVTATYSDGSSEEVEAEFTGYDMTTAGAQTVTVSYEGKTTTYEITVNEAAPAYTAEVTAIDDGENVYYYVYNFVLEDEDKNGESEVKIGDTVLYWSEETQSYVGVIDEDNYDAETETFSEVSIVDDVDELNTLTCGDVTGDGKVNNSDLVALKNYLQFIEIPAILPAADVNHNGSIENSDLLMYKAYIELGTPLIQE